ncbi:GIY-YIG nuclease family protein [Schlesneria paludicola]|uniref:GIY-YIG nuclease family protein n=1 Tax=Schlesneria paludicola TaxID=360056 RepID=UPI0021BBE665|nr:GIY-YIG nuclease family protein [Schlesneria paludicola]
MPATLTGFQQGAEATVENDDKTYTPEDLLGICRITGVQLVYDVHHHRCNPDGLSIEDATKKALATWDREALFHVSSPMDGWSKPKPERHHDFINITDFPECWRGLGATIEVEAKAKEVAVLKLRKQLSEQWLVYIMRCADGSLYTGITNDLERRVEQHNAGTAARYTRSRLPVVCVYRELQQNQSMASKRELAIKLLSLTAKEALIRMMNEGK